MTQMEKIKLCVVVVQRRVEQFLVRVNLEPMEIPLHKTCVTFTQKNAVLFHRESEPKMCNSLNNIIMRIGH